MSQDDLQVRQDSSIRWRTIVRNNLVSLLLHGAVTVVYFIFVVAIAIVLQEINAVDAALNFAVFGSFLLAVVIYALCGFKYLIPLSRGNLLSLLLLPVLLAVLPLAVGYFMFCISGGIIFTGFFDNGAAHSLGAMINAPAVWSITPLFGYFMTVDPYTAWEPPAIQIVAAIVPSICMYAGIRLQMGRKGEYSQPNQAGELA